MKCCFCTRADRGGSACNPGCMFSEPYGGGEELSVCCDAPFKYDDMIHDNHCQSCGLVCDTAREGRAVMREISARYSLPLYKIVGIINDWRKNER